MYGVLMFRGLEMPIIIPYVWDRVYGVMLMVYLYQLVVSLTVLAGRATNKNKYSSQATCLVLEPYERLMGA